MLQRMFCFSTPEREIFQKLLQKSYEQMTCRQCDVTRGAVGKRPFQPYPCGRQWGTHAVGVSFAASRRKPRLSIQIHRRVKGLRGAQPTEPTPSAARGHNSRKAQILALPVLAAKPRRKPPFPQNRWCALRTGFSSGAHGARCIPAWPLRNRHIFTSAVTLVGLVVQTCQVCPRLPPRHSCQSRWI